MSAFAVRYKTVDLGDVQMFYREAGARTAPTVLLLHGFPTSSHMYRDLIPRLLAFVDALELERFAMMVFDYGAPVGFRLAAAHPRRIAAIITQNGNAYEEGAPDVQLDLFGDYKSNLALYPRWHEYLRTVRPPLLAVWGKGDPFFSPAGAHAFRNDVPDAEIHLFDTGHFALETDGPEIATLIRAFLSSSGIETQRRRG